MFLNKNSFFDTIPIHFLMETCFVFSSWSLPHFFFVCFALSECDVITSRLVCIVQSSLQRLQPVGMLSVGAEPVRALCSYIQMLNRHLGSWT